jgi:type IV pilus assembly protein PilV
MKPGFIHNRESQHCASQRRSLQRGMTLVEVLVTLIIMSVGLLGVAALQLASLRNNYDAYVRSQAAVLAADIFDRMRANRTAALNNQYDVTTGSYSNTSTQAERDITDWKATLLAQLPQGDGAVNRDLVTGVVTISIQWGERNGTPGGTILTFQTSSVI